MLTIAQIAPLKSRDPYLYESLVKIIQAVNSLGQQVGSDPVGVFKITPDISSVSVTAANGLFNVQIIDNSQLASTDSRPITYFLEFATDSGFTNIVHTDNLGPHRNKNVFLGNQTLFIRAYSQLFGSAASHPVAYGGATPISLAGGGVAAPTQQAYQGSGTSTIGGEGFGRPIRSEL